MFIFNYDPGTYKSNNRSCSCIRFFNQYRQAIQSSNISKLYDDKEALDHEDSHRALLMYEQLG
ncbi:hypothetical protein GCM10008022_08650 [Paenibacillus hunanensis]|nr:hypothetical protein GCM10008022_08650 [Paenibacillus hunanensis]